LTLENQSLLIVGSESLEVPFASIVSADMFAMLGFSRMIKLICCDQILFLTPVHFNLAGYFAWTKFSKAGELFESIKAQI